MISIVSKGTPCSCNCHYINCSAPAPQRHLSVPHLLLACLILLSSSSTPTVHALHPLLVVLQGTVEAMGREMPWTMLSLKGSELTLRTPTPPQIP